jgi:type VI secretion system protein VasG
LRTIAATTWAEYRKYFETDAALVRRFQVVKIDEPDDEKAAAMMRGLVKTLEGHHGTRILTEAAIEAVRLSRRYISGRQLPDKSVSLLDTACARVALGSSTTPPEIEDRQRRIENLDSEMKLLRREQASGSDHEQRLVEMKEEKEQLTGDLAGLQSRWAKEQGLVEQIRELRAKLEAASEPNSKEQSKGVAEREKLLGNLQAHTVALAELQGDQPLVPVCVDAHAVAEVVSDWTGIPVGRMVTDEIKGILDLESRLQKRILGQSHALAVLAQTITVARANLHDPRHPVGVFLFVGPSGVGKTETAIALADLLFGDDQNMTVINMSEFKEEHKVSLLMGSPPGYVGYREGGVLTEAVRRRPYSLVLLDEMEKAHSGVQDIFYQVFDKGILRDGEGRDIDFKNTVIIMTSNVGTDTIMKYCAAPETKPDSDGLSEAVRPELLKTFKPAFLGRVSVVPFYPLDEDALKTVIEMQLERVGRRISNSYGATFSYAPDLVENIAARCREVETGARNIDHILNRSLLPEVSGRLLARLGSGESVTRIYAAVEETGRFRYEIQ